MKWAVPFGFPLSAAFLVTGCIQAVAQPVPLVGFSKTLTVKGQYQPLKIDQVAGVSMKNGQLVVRGSFETVTVDLPPAADASTVIRHWALVTEAHVDNKRVLTFTHDESLDDFTLELPATDAEIRYGVFAGASGDEVMMLIWGSNAKCFWGHVAIRRGLSPPAGR